MISVTIKGETKEYPKGTRLLEIAREYQEQYENDIVLGMADNKLRELTWTLEKDCELDFFTTGTVYGNDTYRRSGVMLMLTAFHEVCKGQEMNVIVQHFMGKGYYCTVEGDVALNEELLAKVEAHMHELVEEKAPFEKHTVPTGEASEFFHQKGLKEKEKLFRFRRSSRVNIYQIHGFQDYFYGYMVPDTGYLKHFALQLYDEGFRLQLPVKEAPQEIPEFSNKEKEFKIVKEYSRWKKVMQIETVGALNEFISQGKTSDIILVQEALQEQKIADIAKTVAGRENVKFILIAGPSSSGKTTFSHRLSIQLRACGLHPHPIAVDNYFVNREDNPKDENGEYDFEAFEAIDKELFCSDMKRLLAGECVELPSFDFKQGRRNYKGNMLKLGEEDILVIEGIHCLNEKLTDMLPKESKYKIYISPMTQLSIDEHNPIASTDCRLLRRIVRDSRTRGSDAEDTIARWQSVRRGEERNIFPFQEEADVMFNSSIIYELSVLKQYVEPLLFAIPVDSPYYPEGKRMLKFLDYFLGMVSDAVPADSLIREFIGGGCFLV